MRRVRLPVALVVVCGFLLGLTPTWGAGDEPPARLPAGTDAAGPPGQEPDDAAGSTTPDGGAAGLSADGSSGREMTPRDATAPSYLDWCSRPFRLDTREFTFTQKYYWHRLFHPTPRDKAFGAGVLAGAFSLWTRKNQIQSDMAQRDTPMEHAHTLKTIQKLGGGVVVPATALLLYAGGSTFRDYRAKETGFMLAQSLLLTDLVTLGGRWVLAEDRPKYGGSLRPFHGVGGGISGHAATAASVSGVLSRMYLQVTPDDAPARRAWKRIGKGLAYGAPVVVAFERVNLQQHFLYNTVLGLSIGFWSGNTVADAHGLYVEGTPSRWKPSAIGPVTNDRGAPGVGARWIF